MVERLNPQLSTTEKNFIRPELNRLLEELELPNTTHQRRGEIGDRLCVIGDNRRGIGLDSNGLPDIVWCFVPAGNISLSDEYNVNLQIPVSQFYIAKYPVTYAQYQVFVNSGGYSENKIWENLAKHYDVPDESRYKYSNYPQDTVNWYEAVAYCRWLTMKFKETGLGIEMLEQRWEIRLPTEWEWQLAATGGDPQNLYPWGKDWNSNYANVMESGLGRSMAVGMYPSNRSLTGSFDMSGGVWEWCLNTYSDIKSTELTGQATRVFRGGSFTRDKLAAQTTFRFHSDPLSRRYDLGLRLALIPSKIKMEVEKREAV